MVRRFRMFGTRNGAFKRQSTYHYFLFLSRFMQARRQNYLKADVCTSKAVVGEGEKKNKEKSHQRISK